MKTISVRDFSEYPGLRNCSISEDSGELFYHTILNKEFHTSYLAKEKITINLDSTGGFASSFLDEAFGNLVFDFTLKEVKKLLEIVSIQEPHWKKMIENETYNQWEQRRIDSDFPKVTEKHEPWYRLINGKIELKEWQLPFSI